MMTDSNVPEAEGLKEILGLLDHPQLFRRHRFAVGNTGTEAGHLGFIGGRQAQLRRKLANLLLCQADFFERCADLELPGGLRAWTKVARIAGVLSVGDHFKTS